MQIEHFGETGNIVIELVFRRQEFVKLSLEQ